MSIEEKIFKLKFPNEEFNANDYNDWAKENESEAYKLCLQIAKLADASKEEPKGLEELTGYEKSEQRRLLAKDIRTLIESQLNVGDDMRYGNWNKAGLAFAELDLKYKIIDKILSGVSNTKSSEAVNITNKDIEDLAITYANDNWKWQIDKKLSNKEINVDAFKQGAITVILKYTEFLKSKGITN